jgi:hypothetical protein
VYCFKIEDNEVNHRMVYLCVGNWIPYHYFMADPGVGENGNSDVDCHFVYVVLGTIDCWQGVTPQLGN